MNFLSFIITKREKIIFDPKDSTFMSKKEMLLNHSAYQIVAHSETSALSQKWKILPLKFKLR